MSARVPAGVSSGGQFAASHRAESPVALPLGERAHAVAMAEAASRGDGRALAEAMAAAVADIDVAAAAELRARTYAPMDTAPGSSEHQRYSDDERACSAALGPDQMLLAAGVATWDTARILADRDLQIVVQVAARALLARDEVGASPGWDADAYDRMSAPWREIVGQLHPGDQPIRATAASGR